MPRSGTKVIALLASLLISLPLLAGEAIWIDVRTPGEFEAGHIEGAVNVPHTEIADRITEVTENKDATLYLYCRSGRRSGIATDVLKDMGYSGVSNVGGFEQARKKAGTRGAG